MNLLHRFLAWLDCVRGRPVTARGSALTYIASVLGVDRLEGESDRKLRARVLAALYRGEMPCD